MTQTVSVQYIYHSGFKVETGDHVLIFDYFRGTVELSAKKTLVFSSHSHPDHFNPKILRWQQQKPDLIYVFSDDINPVSKTAAIVNPQNLYRMPAGRELTVEDITVRTFGSTDLGVSFLVRLPQLTIFHAGDLNWWCWPDDTPAEAEAAETPFKAEIAAIKATGTAIDLAFFPVDPRLEHNYNAGADYFIREVAPRYLVPMHFGDDFSVPQLYAQKTAEAATEVITFAHKGHEIELQL